MDNQAFLSRANQMNCNLSIFKKPFRPLLEYVDSKMRYTQFSWMRKVPSFCYDSMSGYWNIFNPFLKQEKF